MREIKFQVILKDKIVGIERLNQEQWQWMHYDLNSDNFERWTPGVYCNYSYGLIRRLYTGQKDKNQKEIFDGDIVRLAPPSQDAIHVVRWYEAEFRTVHIKKFAACDCHRSPGTKPNLKNWQRMEVIGNIYENRNLIKT